MLLRSFFAIIIAAVVFPAVSHAQYRYSNRQPLLQRPARILGVWHGSGRHWQTPGHDPSCYNPWSAHNSALVSQGNEGQTHYGHGHYHAPTPIPNYGVDPLYHPTPTLRPQRPTEAPLGGSYEPFGDKDVDEKVPEIEPAEGKPAKNKESGENEFPAPPQDQSSLDFPIDAYHYSTQSNAQSTEQSSSIQWDEIEF